MAFDTVNARRSMRRRYCMPKPEAAGSFTAEERQMLRWLWAAETLAMTLPGRNTRGTLTKRPEVAATLVYT